MVDLSIFINSTNPKGLPACLYWITQNVVNNPLRVEILSREITPEMKEFSSVLHFTLIKDNLEGIEVAKAPLILYTCDSMIPWKNSLQFLVNNARHHLNNGIEFVCPSIYSLPQQANTTLDKYKANLTSKMVDYCLREPKLNDSLSSYIVNKKTAFGLENHYGMEFKTEVCPEVIFLMQDYYQ